MSTVLLYCHVNCDIIVLACELYYCIVTSTVILLCDHMNCNIISSTGALEITLFSDPPIHPSIHPTFSDHSPHPPPVMSV